MEDIEIKINPEKFKKILVDALPKIFSNIMTGSNSPLTEAIIEEIKNKDGTFRMLLNEIITDLTKSNEFKEEIKQRILSKVWGRVV